MAYVLSLDPRLFTQLVHGCKRTRSHGRPLAPSSRQQREVICIIRRRLRNGSAGRQTSSSSRLIPLHIQQIHRYREERRHCCLDEGAIRPFALLSCCPCCTPPQTTHASALSTYASRGSRAHPRTEQPCARIPEQALSACGQRLRDVAPDRRACEDEGGVGVSARGFTDLAEDRVDERMTRIRARVKEGRERATCATSQPPAGARQKVAAHRRGNIARGRREAEWIMNAPPRYNTKFPTHFLSFPRLPRDYISRGPVLKWWRWSVILTLKRKGTRRF
jgi:hypothetical protein